MKVAFYSERTQIPEIGTGHYWRSKAVSGELVNRGHDIFFIDDNVETIGADILVIDHINSKKYLIDKAKTEGTKVILVDGDAIDIPFVDASVSAFLNFSATNTGIKYIAFPKPEDDDKYNPNINSNSIFVAMGGFDANNLAELVIPIVIDAGFDVLVAKSDNHPDFSMIYERVKMYEHENYYDAMKQCVAAITGAGLTLFQVLSFGMPTLAVPQYRHQIWNIDAVASCCVSVSLSREGLENKFRYLMESKERRKRLSILARQTIDGNGINRIADIIEQL